MTLIPISMFYNITALGVRDTEPFNTMLGELQIIPMDHNFDIFKQISLLKIISEYLAVKTAVNRLD